ncbi:MAG: carbon storage regulator CsrA [Treponema sp.]|nr:carbon storage regulator CsrA [Treponema sp.]
MLILSRRRDEKIVIGDNIIVSVVEVRGDIVKLGIEAPRNVKVYREEVFEAIRNENAAAVASAPALPDLDFPGGV